MTKPTKDEIKDMIERFTEGFNRDDLDYVMEFFLTASGNPHIIFYHQFERKMRIFVHQKCFFISVVLVAGWFALLDTSWI